MAKKALTLELIDQLAELVQAGHYPKVVCQQVGIGPVTFNRWLKDGEDLLARHDSGIEWERSDDEHLLMVFATEINLAYATAEITMLDWSKSLAAMGKGSWTMPFTWLERTRPGWQRRENLGDVNATVDEELRVMEREFAAFDRKRSKETR